MAVDTEQSEHVERRGLSRRDMIRASAIAGAAAWTAPVIIDSLSSPAAASLATAPQGQLAYVVLVLAIRAASPIAPACSATAGNVGSCNFGNPQCPTHAMAAFAPPRAAIGLGVSGLDISHIITTSNSTTAPVDPDRSLRAPAATSPTSRPTSIDTAPRRVRPFPIQPPAIAPTRIARRLRARPARICGSPVLALSPRRR